MAKESVNKTLYDLNPSSIIDLYIIDTTDLDDNKLPPNEQIFYLHNFKTANGKNIYFDGQKYLGVPTIFSGNEIKSDGTQLPKPRFGITNEYGYASKILSQTGGLLGAKFIRRRIFAKFLDAQTWDGDVPSWNISDTGAVITEDIFYFDKKIIENKQLIEMELATAIELEGVKIPRRQMFANNCPFAYRNSSGCGFNSYARTDMSNKPFYMPTGDGGYGFTDPVGSIRGEWAENVEYSEGDSVYILTKQKSEIISGTLPDGMINTGSFKYFVYVCANDNVSGSSTNPIFDRSNWITDSCSKKIVGCRARFGNQLNFGGFPALTRIGFAE